MSQSRVLGQALYEVSTVQRFPLGTIVEQVATLSGQTYVSRYQYVVAGEAITVGRFCNETYDVPFEIEMGTDATALKLYQSGGGIALVAMANAEYGWILYDGVWVDAATHVTRSNSGAVEVMRAVAATGVISDEAIGDNPLNIGMYTATDVAILSPPEGRGAHAT